MPLRMFQMLLMIHGVLPGSTADVRRGSRSFLELGPSLRETCFAYHHGPSLARKNQTTPRLRNPGWVHSKHLGIVPSNQPRVSVWLRSHECTEDPRISNLPAIRWSMLPPMKQKWAEFAKDLTPPKLNIAPEK